MKTKIFPFLLIIIISAIFVIFYKGLQNSNVYEPQIGNQKNIPVFIAKAFETEEIFKSEDIFKGDKFIFSEDSIVIEELLQKIIEIGEKKKKL